MCSDKNSINFVLSEFLGFVDMGLYSGWLVATLISHLPISRPLVNTHARLCYYSFLIFISLSQRMSTILYLLIFLIFISLLVISSLYHILGVFIELGFIDQNNNVVYTF